MYGGQSVQHMKVKCSVEAWREGYSGSIWSDIRRLHDGVAHNTYPHRLPGTNFERRGSLKHVFSKGALRAMGFSLFFWFELNNHFAVRNGPFGEEKVIQDGEIVAMALLVHFETELVFELLENLQGKGKLSVLVPAHFGCRDGLERLDQET
ncbi:hypothetical protein GQ43DRAFT_427748 [Delitschia confertaspora ATCC 74209]|uniref:Uncharacterized protein n=1 Tax=Delitschia confertaspora ATCC 74209 TaxID=1513339 RepID=A0A9P4MTX0_9PLEO|nr:hypothetical protein GQ43DRAFT_427748 [Delitschia confertaspora ATCC 74209]